MLDGSLYARVVSAGALLMLCVAARGALAQPAAPTGDDAQANEARRSALYGEGVDAATAGHWADAKERFAAVLAIRTSPKVLFSLAQAEEHLGQVASASADYGRALDGAKAAGESDVVDAVEQARKTIAPRVPHIRVRVDGARAPMATLDGQPIAVNADIAVDPGAHRLVVNAPGMREASATVAISERQDLEVPIPVVMEPIGSTPHRSGPWRIAGILVGVGGLGAVAVGAAFGAVTLGDKSTQISECASSTQCPNPSGAAAAHDDGIMASTVSTIAFIAGGALLVTGVVLFFTAPSRPKSGLATRKNKPSVTLGPSGLGLALRGAF